MERCCFVTTRITEFLFFLWGFLVAVLAWMGFKAIVLASLLAVLFFLYILSNSVLAYASACFAACKFGFNDETTTAHQPCLCLLILHPWVSAAILPQHLKITQQLLNLVKPRLFQTTTSWQKKSQGLHNKLHWIFAATNLDGVFWRLFWSSTNVFSHTFQQ